jgi:hypothetical protein
VWLPRRGLDLRHGVQADWLKKRPEGGVASGRYNATPSARCSSSCLFALAQQVRHQQPAGATALPYSLAAEQA